MAEESLNRIKEVVAELWHEAELAYTPHEQAERYTRWAVELESILAGSRAAP